MEEKALICLNCESNLNKVDKFCAKCGRSTLYKNLSIIYIIKTFLDSFLNFDTRIIHSLKDIWSPNKISHSFLAGKRGYYLHPFRFYFITLVIFFGLIALNSKELEINTNQVQKKIALYDYYTSIDTMTFSTELECEAQVIDSLKAQIPKDALSIATDTLFKGTAFGTDWSEFGISTYDLYKLSVEEFDEKYKIKGTADRYLIHQAVRVIKDPSAALRFGIGNMLWGLLLLTASVAFSSWILYIRHKSYYVEHLLIITHYHIVNMWLLSIGLLGTLIFDHEAWAFFMLISIPISSVYLFLSLKRYFNNNFFYTFIKVSILYIGYFFSFTFIAVLIGLLTVAIF